MEGTKGAPAGVGLERTQARRWSAWHDGGPVVALATAVALWIGVLAGIAAPLGGVLARLDAPAPAPPACATPPDALASAARAGPARSCP